MKKVILVVEDDENIMNNLTELLSSEGYEVMCGSDGTEGVALLKQTKPDLIICDIMMPKMNGYEFHKYVKSDFDTKFIPFIFLTAHSDLSSIRAGLNLGVDDYITKPFSSSDLLKAIEIRMEKQKEVRDQFNSLIKNINMYIPHELRTPLVSIIGYSHLVLEGIEEMEKTQLKEMVERILWSANRLHNRIEKFIAYAELNVARSKPSERKNTDEVLFDKMLIDSIIENHYMLRERSDDIKISVLPAEIEVDDLQMVRMLKEILENSAKYSEAGSSVEVNGTCSDELYTIEIKDSGIGMTDSEIEQIGLFQQFSREDFSQQGNGLGLAIVKNIVQMHGGSLEIESKKKSHTIVRVKLPCKKA